MVSDVNFTTIGRDAQGTQQASAGLADDFADFLNLLTVQLQNQDPLEPMDSTEFTNQLVAFTGVEQQINTNQKLDNMLNLEVSNALTNAIGYIGTTISYLGSEINYEGGTSRISYAFTSAPETVTINILNEEGQRVFNTSEVPRDVGSNEFVWDGLDSNGNPVPPGIYSVSVDALDSNDAPVQSSLVVEGRVSGVEQQNGAILAIVGERAVPVGNILNAKEPAVIETEEADTAEGTQDNNDNNNQTQQN